MVKKGDTLIEVLLAVGIFSMIAISVVAVMSGGTSEAQLALETTLTREEIDAQAEALRYIHDSYINDKNATNENGGKNENLPTIDLWRTITSNAITLSGDNSDNDIVEYAPETCTNILDANSDIRDHAFVLDTRRLNQNNAVAYIRARPTNGEDSIFFPASTYPRLIFGNSDGNLTEQNAGNINVGRNNLVGDLTNLSALNRVEGMYIIAVADLNTTTVLDLDGNPTGADKGPAYYDFYIRTCWYGTDAETPSTISTVIRLHNPDVATEAQMVYISDGGGNFIPTRSSSSGTNDIPNEKFWPAKHEKGWTFDGWCYQKVDKNDPDALRLSGEDIIDGECNGIPIGVNETFVITNPEEADSYYIKRKMFTHTKYTINYDSNGSSWKRDPQICYEDENSNCIVQADGIKRSGYEFMGWCTGNVNTENGNCNGTVYQKGDIVPIPSGFNSSRQLGLKAIWRESNRIITIRADWTSATDYDSYMQLTDPNTQRYTSASWATTNINVTYHNQTYSLVTGLGDGRGSYNGRYYEEFVINTLGGKNYYYSIRRWPDGNVGNDITIKVNIKNPETGDSENYTYYSSNRNCTDNYWNVFGYRDGAMINRNTCSASMQYDYE